MASCSDGKLLVTDTSLPFAYVAGTTSSVEVETFTAWAPMIQINRRSADRGPVQTSSPTAATSTGTAGGAQQSTSTSSTGNTTSTISGGAIAGIVIGATSAVIVVNIFLWWYFVSYAKAKQRRVTTLPWPPGGNVDGQSKMDIPAFELHVRPAELPETAVYELQEPLAEIAANDERESR